MEHISESMMLKTPDIPELKDLTGPDVGPIHQNIIEKLERAVDDWEQQVKDTQKSFKVSTEHKKY